MKFSRSDFDFEAKSDQNFAPDPKNRDLNKGLYESIKQTQLLWEAKTCFFGHLFEIDLKLYNHLLDHYPHLIQELMRRQMRSSIQWFKPHSPRCGPLKIGHLGSHLEGKSPCLFSFKSQENYSLSWESQENKLAFFSRHSQRPIRPAFESSGAV